MAIPHSRLHLLHGLMIISAAFWVFTPSLQGDWIMDDTMYITQNPLLGDPHRLWKIWFEPGSLFEYYPIQETVQAVQWHFWHLQTLGYHATNLILHVAGALLVWRLLAKFGLRLAWLGGFLFAIHPAQIESVAWISELKNTLSLPPFLLAMCAWIDYQERGRPRDYFLALGLFLIAMLCKVSMAPFPFVILLYAWWKRRRIVWTDLKTAVPFFVVSLALGLTTIRVGKWFQEAHLQTTVTPPIGGLPAHFALAGWTISFYFSKFFWPADLLPVYPRWPINCGSILTYLPWPIMVAALFYLWTKRASWGRHALLGVGFFLIMLAPFLGFNSVTYMGFTWVMDHFLYLPMIGLIGLVIAALGDMENHLPAPAQPLFAMVTALVLALLAWKSYTYAGKFVGPEAIWSYTIEHNPDAWLAHNNLGNVLLETGRAQEAITEYQKALQLNPTMTEALNNLGFALEQTGRTNEAMAQYVQALKINPHYAVANANLAGLLERTGRVKEAIAHYKEDLLVNPRDENARASLHRLEATPSAPQNQRE